MPKQTWPRVAAVSGAVFAILLLAAGNGSHAYAVEVIGLAALTLFLPFLTYLWCLLRDAEGANGWLSTTAFASGLVGLAVKFVSVAPEIANRHVTEGTPLHRAIEDTSSAAFVVSLYPLALMLTAVAALSLRTGVLPRWLGIGAAVAALALAINGGFLDATFGPALVLFVLWTLVTSVVLFRNAPAAPARSA